MEIIPSSILIARMPRTKKAIRRQDQQSAKCLPPLTLICPSLNVRLQPVSLRGLGLALARGLCKRVGEMRANGMQGIIRARLDGD